ncbi:MAG: hypothetical protein LBI02_02330 [Opitutaceae bacterium]|jgi:hypothetical protein|nr:hypothetical protein [Opitutaceae bacterium]
MKNQTQTNTGGKYAPEFIPLSQRGPDPVFGLSRSSYYNLEKAGAIRLVRVRKPGNMQGRVLIDCNSVRRYLAKLANEQDNRQKASSGSGVEA